MQFSYVFILYTLKYVKELCTKSGQTDKQNEKVQRKREKGRTMLGPNSIKCNNNNDLDSLELMSR